MPVKVEYPEGTVALINIKNVKNVKAFRRKTSVGYDWAFSPVPELGLNITCANDHEVGVVKVLEVEGTPDPEAKTYDIEIITPREIQNAIDNIVGTGPKDEYDDAKGTDGFWHLLAGTKTVHEGEDRYSHGVVPENYKFVADGVLVIDGLGTFTRVEFETAYDETGDLDCTLVFKLGSRYFSLEQNLDSWSQGCWESGMKQVKPVEKKITVWERV